MLIRYSEGSQNVFGQNLKKLRHIFSVHISIFHGKIYAIPGIKLVREKAFELLFRNSRNSQISRRSDNFKKNFSDIREK